MKKTLLSMLALAAMSFVPAANAASLLVISDGISTVTVDQTGAVSGCGAGCTLTATVGSDGLIVTGDLGVFNGPSIVPGLNITARGDLTSIPPELQNLNQIDVNSGGAGTLTVTFFDNAVNLTPAFIVGTSGVVGAGITSSEIDFSTYASAGSTLPFALNAGSLIGAFNDQSGLAFSAQGTFASPIASTTGSLASRTVIAFAGPGTIQANITISAIPEPSSVALFGSILLVAGVALRRKFAAAA